MLRLMLVLAASLVPAVAAGQIRPLTLAPPPGSYADPAGDSIPTDDTPTRTYDLSFVDFRRSGPNFVITAGGTPNETPYVTFVVDADRNPATGLPGIDADGTDSALIGWDYIVDVTRFGTAVLDSNFNFLGTFNTQTFLNGLRATLPASLFGGNVLMAYKATGGIAYNDALYSTITDYASDVGSPALLTRIPYPAGDTDFDNDVDFDDLGVLLGNYETTVPAASLGDGDLDGDVDFDDLGLLLGNYGVGLPGQLDALPSNIAIPEPGSMALAAIAFAGLFRRRR